jgi:hypothetical protein
MYAHNSISLVIRVYAGLDELQSVFDVVLRNSRVIILITDTIWNKQFKHETSAWSYR